MLRGLFLFFKLGLIAAVAVWIASNPGMVSVQWLGYQMDTSVGVLISGVLALMLVFGLFIWLLKSLIKFPSTVSLAYRSRQLKKALDALVEGGIAFIAGDEKETLKQAQRMNITRATAIYGLWFQARLAVRAGNREEAMALFTRMGQMPEGEFMSLRGFTKLALLEGKKATALQYAEKAYAIYPTSPWVLKTLFHLYLEKKSFDRAELMLDQWKARKGKEKDLKNDLKSSLYFEKAQQENMSLDSKLDLLGAGFDLAPQNASLAEAYAKCLQDSSKSKKAQKVLEKCWELSQDYNVAQAYISLAPVGRSIEQYTLAQKLMALTPASKFANIIIAEAALKAKLWGEARAHLKKIPSVQETPYIYELWAKLEEAEKESPEVVAKWRDRALKGLSDFTEKRHNSEARRSDAGRYCGSLSCIMADDVLSFPSNENDSKDETEAS
ncbi:MAG: tetratricopeptide repeat protein [Alphaproteobacteria bacterium]|jgi:HemY protein|nr:tetratricopeptide repeat protein [Alphaproteobacteria bacterium]MBT5389974.1 tetratricopeptide repeat protein [Alphaproteobacteria bacterium]MBT5541116.1 tetratricopeptide repeat protein [Alphaproteobacteria bacterium]MBT5654045.1 tetratricopeptide repeat protein [Alphaproteobacteria bacterium]